MNYLDERIKPGCFLYQIEEVGLWANEMTSEEKKAYIKDKTPSVVKRVYFKSLETKDKTIPLYELYYYYIIQNPQGEIIPSYDQRLKVEKFHEGYFDFNPSAVNSFIHSGLSFIHEPKGIYMLSDEEKKKKERFNVPEGDLYLGMTFNGNHYSIEDLFLYFSFFKENGEEVSLNMLKYLYAKQRPLFLYQGLYKDGFCIYENFEGKLSHELTNEEKTELIKSKTPLKVVDYSESHILCKNDYITNRDIYYFYILTDEKGTVIDSEHIFKHLTYILPNLFNYSAELVRKYIRKGMTYIFSPSGYASISSEEESLIKRYTILNEHTFNGITSNGGFLDASDMLYNCVFFDETGNKVDLNPLRKAFESSYQIPVRN